MKRKVTNMATIQEKANQFLHEHQMKVNGLNQKLQDTSARVQYLEMEVRMLSEVEIPTAQANALLNDADAGLVTKRKKALKKYQDELQEALENQVIYTNGIKQLNLNAGEEASKLLRLLKEETVILTKKQYAKMMHAKYQYTQTLIEESKVVKEANKCDTALQSLLVASGRKSQVYSENLVQSNINRNGLGRFGDTYLSMTHQELGRFIQGTYTESDIDYLIRYKDKKDLS
jgi:hypothetical protein